MSAALKKSAYHVRQILQQLDDRRSPEHKECRHYVIGRPVKFRSLMPMAPECNHCVIGRPILAIRQNGEESIRSDGTTDTILERSGRMEKRESDPMSAALTVKESRVRQPVTTTALALKAERPEGPVKCPLWARRLAVVSS